MQKILLVEDSPDIQGLVEESLSDTYEIRVAGNLQNGLEAIRRDRFDLVLLDIHLPDGDGFALCTELRGQKGQQPPVIFLTAASEIDDKLRAFSLGADDYVVKPFHTKELRARIETRLRAIVAQQSQSSGGDRDSFQRGDLLFDLVLQRVSGLEGSEKKDLDLTPSEFKLLSFLARHQGEYFNRDQLLNKVWKSGVHVVQENIYTHISSIRKKLGARAQYLESIPKVGYRFQAADPNKRS